MVLFLSMGSQVFGAGSDDISGFSWDEGTVGVGNETFDSFSVVWGNWASWSNKWGTMGSQVCGTGSNNISGFSWYYGTVGVGNETPWVSCISVTGISWVSSISVSGSISQMSSISSTVSQMSSIT